MDNSNLNSESVSILTESVFFFLLSTQFQIFLLNSLSSNINRCSEASILSLLTLHLSLLRRWEEWVPPLHFSCYAWV